MIKASTKFGTIEGRLKGNAVLFAGIPYAKPPVGPLRFRPAQDPEPWSGIRSAKKWAPSSLQLSADRFGNMRVVSGSSEDCLYLNVRTPAPQIPENNGTADTVIDTEAGLPVYVFIHGGAYLMGGCQVPLYDGRKFADQGIVYVNINYRLGIMGCMHLEALEAEDEEGISGCYNVSDVKKALEWIHDNIRAFGGDPDNITIGGESAGAFLVSTMLHTDAAGTLFRRAILESGAVRGTAPKRKYGRSHDIYMKKECRRLVEDLGASDSAEGLEKLREISAEELVLAWYAGPDGRPRGVTSDPSVGMYLYGRDRLPDPGEIHAEVDLLFGFNTDEGTMFTPQFTDEREYIETIKDYYPNNYEQCLERFPVDAAHGPRERMAYIIGSTAFKSAVLAYGDKIAENGGNVWAYHFDYLTEQLAREGLGVRHIVELHFVFDRYLNAVGADDDEGHALAEKINSAWVSFIKTGNPVNVDAPGISWPRYSRENRQCIRFGHDISRGEIEGLEDLLYLEELLVKEYGENYETE